jgi:hypothetical protein
MYWSRTQLDTLNSTSIFLDPFARGPQILALQRPNPVQCLGQAVDEEEFAQSLEYGAAVIDSSGAEVRGGLAFLIDNFDWQAEVVTRSQWERENESSWEDWLYARLRDDTRLK